VVNQQKVARRGRAASRQRQGEGSRQAILEATLAIASERGYDGTTMALVTERTGLPRSSIYWHFGNKDKLLAATLEYSYQKWRGVAPTWKDRPEPEGMAARVTARFEEAARALAENPQFWGLGLMLSMRAWVEEPEALRIFKKVRADTERELASWWTDILDPAAVRHDPGLPLRLGRFWVVMMDGVYLQLRGTSVADSARLFDRLITGFTHYLAVTGAGRDG
jgi:AcrR family transcriptional regulator